MRISKEANRTIAKLWSDGKVQPTEYRLLTYTIQTEVESGTLLYNVITGEMLHLDAQESIMLSDLPCSYASWMDDLIKKHFLVSVESDDKKTVDALRLALKHLEASKDITRYIILPTTNCNARCFYCYEAGCKHENMSDETADKLIDFMDAHRGGTPLHISWFGGEPLVGLRQIDRICDKLNKRQIPFYSYMTSNAFLFDEEIVKRAKEDWKLCEIIITLDGTEKIYNETKAYVNPCENPFQRVIRNIGLLLNEGIHVEIRFNIGLHNADDLFTLVDMLDEKFKDKSNIWAFVAPVDYGCGYKKLNISQEQSDLITTKLRAFYLKIAKVFPNVFKDELLFLKHNCCMMDNDSSLLVHPSGAFGKCPDHIEMFHVGSVEEGLPSIAALKALKECVSYSQCGHCPLYPHCIKLKHCKYGLTCNENDVKLRIEGMRDIMKRLYEEFLISEQGEVK